MNLSQIIKWVTSQGWTVTKTADGYTRFYDPKGNYIVQYPNTPKSPTRRLTDVKVALKKAGVQIPPPSKKEQRAQRKKGDQK